ncbi:putative lipoprotein [Burkholderiales bacterium JOSHI_001]|nr:putative lipoprotein [Burkholderiales bacterium JOSHI_001]
MRAGSHTPPISCQGGRVAARLSILGARNVNPVNPPALRAVSLAAAVLGAAALGGCSSMESFLSGDKIDYKSQAQRTASLDVPPDLTQLAREGRYLPQQGSVSASALAAAPAAGTVAAAAAAATVVAPAALGDVQLMRSGNQRWLKTGLKPEQLWPQLRTFWQERGFNLATDSAEVGVMETEWAENRAKLPQDGLRRLLGGILNNLYDTSERDRFRTRVERTTDGTEVYITHRGMEEVLVGQTKEQTVWRPRAADPQLEAEMLARLMLKLGAKEETVRTSVAAVAAPAAAPARARVLAGAPGAALEVDEPFDRAWRRVGVTLDRSGFTVEDRDRNAGLYYVRYVDAKLAAKEEPGFLSRLFGGGDKAPSALGRYRINVKAVGDKSQVSVLDNQGAADKGDVAQRIVSLLVDDLK